MKTHIEYNGSIKCKMHACKMPMYLKQQNKDAMYLSEWPPNS